jgi:CubicO group peptidase (beta-lactamase class C family)
MTRSIVGWLGAAVLAAGCDAGSVHAGIDLSQPWVEAAPADVGMDAQALDTAAVHAAGIPRFRSLLAARHGHLVLERYFGDADASTRFDVRSVTKSVVSALTGIAVRDQALPGLDVSIRGYLAPPLCRR